MIWLFLTLMLFIIVWTGYSLWWFARRFNIVDFGPQTQISTFAMIPIVLIIMAFVWVDKFWRKYKKYVWR